jgi:hypothetical protein
MSRSPRSLRPGLDAAGRADRRLLKGTVNAYPITHGGSWVNLASGTRRACWTRAHGRSGAGRDGVAGSRGGPAGDRARSHGDLPGPRRKRTGRRRRGPGDRGPARGRCLRPGPRPGLGRSSRGLVAARPGSRRAGGAGRQSRALVLCIVRQRLRLERHPRCRRDRAAAARDRAGGSRPRAVRRGEGGVRAEHRVGGGRPAADRTGGPDRRTGRPQRAVRVLGGAGRARPARADARPGPPGCAEPGHRRARSRRMAPGRRGGPDHRDVRRGRPGRAVR